MNTSYHERMQRGTPDFPLGVYIIDKTHPRYKMQMHWHKEFEIIRVTKGTLELVLNDNRITLTENQSVFIPGGIMHSADPLHCNYECLVFSPSVLYNVQVCRSLIKTHMQKTVVYNGNRNINSVFSVAKEKKRGYELEVIGLLYLIASEIVQKDDGCSVPPNEKLEKIKAAMMIIEENYTSKITLDELAASCRLSPNYFCRYFKEIVGQTPFEYITVYRIEAACEMLAAGGRNITDVCFACGFNDLSYFIHIFKKYKGVSPGGYLAKHR